MSGLRVSNNTIDPVTVDATSWLALLKCNKGTGAACCEVVVQMSTRARSLCR